MRISSLFVVVVAAIGSVVPSRSAFGQHVPEGLRAHTVIDTLVPMRALASVHADSTSARPSRQLPYSLVGGAVGFIAGALITRSIVCPTDDCIDNAEASYPIVAVISGGVLGGLLGSLIGWGIGAFVDKRESGAARLR